MLAASEERLPALGTRIAQRYRLVRRVGEGAMGAVFEAEREPDGARVAIKTLYRDVAPISQGGAVLARFLREVQVSAALVHPNVVPVTEGAIDPETGFAYLVMTLLSGEDLAGLIARLGALDPRTAVRLVLQAARGLSAAHAQGIIHRDVKPSNLFLDRSASGLVTVKVCDFGVAKAATGDASAVELTRTGNMLGSPLYMAPEQLFNSKRVDVRADVWSLGMTLYEALAGTAALASSRAFTDLVEMLSRGTFPPLQDRAPWVPPELAEVVSGTLLTDVDARCPSMDELAASLSSFVGGVETVTEADLAPVSPAERAVVAAKMQPVARWRSSVRPSATAPAEDPLLGKTLAGRYRLTRLLGQGGMGAVYEAEADGRAFAVKVILPEGTGSSRGTTNADAQKRFLREARAAMSIQSPHVVAVIEADRDAVLGVQYIVMELLSGTDLDKLIRQVGPLEPAAVARAFVQAATGLAAAHERGIVHRDIKPANLFLHETPEGELVVKVCDFGVAKERSTGLEGAGAHDLTRTGGILGSPMYVSPEQARNAKEVDHRADIWSLCLSMHEALTGRKPWHDAGSLADLILAICTSPPPDVQDLAPWVDPQLAAVVRRGVERDPGARHADATALATALEPFARSVPRLTRAALASLTPEKRAPAPKLATNGAAMRSDAAAALASSVAEPRPATRGRSPVLLVLGGVAVLALLAAVGKLALGPGAESGAPARATASAPLEKPAATASATGAATPPSAEAPRPRVRGTLSVKPPGAKVTINGAPAIASDTGDVTLEGEPGDAFDVVGHVGAASASVKAVLSRDGSVNPPLLLVAVGPTGGARRPDKPEPPAPQAPTAKPPTPQAPGVPKPRDEF